MEYLNKKLIRPKGLSKDNLIQIRNFAVSYKIDGEHRFLILEKDKNPIYLDLNNDKTLVTSHIWTGEKYVLEGELYKDTFYAFDIIMNGKDLTTLSFKSRYEHLSDKLLQSLPFYKIKEFIFPKPTETVYSLIKNLKEPELETDGLIFMPQIYGFFDKSVQIFKWKPVEQLTADFLCLKLTGDNKYKVYCSMSIYQFKSMQLYKLPQYKKEMPKFFPIEFSPYLFKSIDVKNDGESILLVNPEQELNNKIVECVWDNDLKYWKPYRIREDKTTAYHKSMLRNEFTGPNNFVTCLQIYKDSLNPLTLEEITSMS